MNNYRIGKNQLHIAFPCKKLVEIYKNATVTSCSISSSGKILMIEWTTKSELQLYLLQILQFTNFTTQVICVVSPKYNVMSELFKTLWNLYADVEREVDK